MRVLLRTLRLAAAIGVLALAVAGTALSPPPAAGAVTAERPRSEIGFRSRERLKDHFRRHGREVGADSPEAYVRIAQRLRDRPVGGAVQEIARPDGSFARFDRELGIFIAFDRNGTILTCFKPRQGEEYFRRQSRRGW